MNEATQKLSWQRAVITRRRNAAKRRETAMGRLGEDGASSPEHINGRLLWIAIEWMLDAPPKVGRTPSLADYCLRHRISFDRMLYGCLKGFRKMVEEPRSRTAAASPSSLSNKFARLSESERELLLKTVEQMLPEGHQ